MIIAIGGGGFIPARMLRSFLKEPGQPNVRIMAIILSLYEEIESENGIEKPGTQVVRTQWIDYHQSKIDLVGKNVLIIDEVDDTRTTLHYAVSELKKMWKSNQKPKVQILKIPSLVFLCCTTSKSKRKQNCQMIL